MNNTNYIAATVKLLEIPKEKFLKNKGSVANCKACLPQVKNNKVIQLFFWGKLTDVILSSYKLNDYLVVEGFVSLIPAKNSKVKIVTLTVFKVYPVFLTANHLLSKNKV